MGGQVIRTSSPPGWWLPDLAR